MCWLAVLNWCHFVIRLYRSRFLSDSSYATYSFGFDGEFLGSEGGESLLDGVELDLGFSLNLLILSNGSLINRFLSDSPLDEGV